MANILIVPTGEGLGSYLDYKTIRNGEQLNHKQTVYHYFTATAALNASFQLKLLLIMPK
jgi:hypothetical protein